MRWPSGSRARHWKSLAACATDPDGHLAPSPLVDVGWHAFLIHTREYAEFCRDVAGQFLHHVPDDPDTPSTPVSAATVRGRTLAAIRAAGFCRRPRVVAGGVGNVQSGQLLGVWRGR